MLYVTKVNGSTSLNDCTTKNGQVNAVTMKDVVDACCNAKRTNIGVNMKAATTVGNIKEPSHSSTYANGKDETNLPRVPDHFAGTSKSDMGINAMIDTVFIPIAATGIDIVEMKSMISLYSLLNCFRCQLNFQFLIVCLYCICEIVNLLSMYCIVLYVTKVNGSTFTKDCTAKNIQVNPVPMKDIVDACCNAKRENIDVNMKAATTVENIKQTKGKMSFTFNMLLNNFRCQLSF